MNDRHSFRYDTTGKMTWYCFYKIGIIRDVPREFCSSVAIKGCDGYRTIHWHQSYSRTDQMPSIKVRSLLGLQELQIRRRISTQNTVVSVTCMDCDHDSWMNLALPEKVRTFLMHRNKHSGWNEVQCQRSFAVSGCIAYVLGVPKS